MIQIEESRINAKQMNFSIQMVTLPHSHSLDFIYFHVRFPDRFTTWLLCQVFSFQDNLKMFWLAGEKKENPLAAALVVTRLAASTETDSYSTVGMSGW